MRMVYTIFSWFLLIAVKKSAQTRASFKLANVTINAKQVVQAMNELEPLAVVMPTDPKERVKYVLPSDGD